MGVLGLWQLLAPVGQPVTLESLENKIFAVDISIWLNQALKGYRDSQGGSVPNAHLLSLFSRLCKLLFYKIRPIIVFDGGFPELKKQTIINRQQRRAAIKQSSREFGLKLLTNYVASQQLGQSVDASNLKKISVKTKEKLRDEIFKLPPLPENSLSILSDSCESNDDNERKFTNFSKEDIKYLNQIDIESEDFDALPPDVKQEILSTLKESRKYRSWDQFNELPKESNEFSNYQMQCLLKKRKLQSKLEEVQKDIRKINSSAYVSQYTNDHVIGETNKIMSDDSSYYVLLKKIIEHKNAVDVKSEQDVKSSTSLMADTKNAFIRDIENIDVEDDLFSLPSNCDKADEVDVKIKTERNSLNLSDEEHDNNFCYSKTNEVAIKANTAVGSMYLSDEEFDVDNPSLVDETKKINIQNIIDSLGVENVEQSVKNTTDDSLSNQGIFMSKEQFTTSDLETQIICERNIDHLEFKTNKNNQRKALSPEKEKLSKTESQSVTLTSIDNVVCDKNVINDNLDASSIKSQVEKDLESKSSVLSEKHHITEFQYESDVRNENFEKNLPSTSAVKEITASNEFQYESDVRNESFEKNLPSTSAVKQITALNDIYSKSSNESELVNEDLREANLELQKDLDAAAAILEAEQAKQDRQSRSVQDHMIDECKELLQLFGIPYVVSPLEAEAQCAFYDIIDFTQGTITDDSDVWLFGGKRVYKNFFTQDKFVECYKDKEIFVHFGLSRKKLINFALLTGSDYTEGIEGVGRVTAMEIISEFPGEGIDALQKFKDWWLDSNKNTRPPENKVRAKFQKLVLAQNFPDEKVFEAYLNPEVDSSMEKFTWGRPDLAALRDYAKERFGWNQSKVDSALLPVLKKLNDRDKQTHLDSFFTVTLKKQTDLFPSKRIMSALKKITSPQKQETEKSAEANSLKRQSKNSGKKVISKKEKSAEVNSLKRKSKNSGKKVISKKVASARGRAKTTQSQGPDLSEESSSDSES